MRENFELLEFAVEWAPYGDAGEEHIFVRFGVSPDRYYRRLLRILDSPDAQLLPPLVRQRIRSHCTERTFPRARSEDTPYTGR